MANTPATNQKRDAGHLPKYVRIAHEIIGKIKGGDLGPGMQIPSENEIIAAHGVSNTTARKALQEIEIAGWGTRIKGKGTFVRQPSVVRTVNKILSFTRNMTEAGLTPSTRVLYQGVVNEDYSATINGRRYTIKGPLYKIHRLRFADDTPMLLEVRYISLTHCPGIVNENLEGSLYAAYERCGVHLAEVQQMLSAITLDTGIKEFFNLEKPIPGLLVEGVTFVAKEVIVEMEHSVYRGDKYRFAIRAT
jgi:GntR family transcriptional regulator